MNPVRKILVLFLALSILNQSIDFDYITYGRGPNQSHAEYDDVDTIVEFILENLTGDEKFTREGNDDSGMAHHHKGLEKHSFSLQYLEQIKKLWLPPFDITAHSWLNALDQANKICKGYSDHSFPPPKA